MSARATAIAVVALLVLGVGLIAQAWRMKDYSLNVSIARERQDDDPEMLRNYHRYFGATEVRFWSVAWICTGLLAQAGGHVKAPNLRVRIRGVHEHEIALGSHDDTKQALRCFPRCEGRSATGRTNGGRRGALPNSRRLRLRRRAPRRTPAPSERIV
jgi:hypothetical protein